MQELSDQRAPAEPPIAPTREAGSAPPDKVCELCGWPVLDRHCKVLCLNCGYVRDCSDP